MSHKAEWDEWIYGTHEAANATIHSFDCLERGLLAFGMVHFVLVFAARWR
jgi:hypothetical protein